MLPFSILSWGGLGDTLRNISLVPHAYLFRKFGIRCAVYYKHWTRTQFRVDTGPPNPKWFEDLVGRCPSLYWAGEVEEYGGLGRFTNLALRKSIQLAEGRPKFHPFEVNLTEAERAALPPRVSPRRIAIQTHLSGMKTKQWGADNWRHYLDDLLAKAADVSVILLDSDERVIELATDQRIQTTHGFSIPQSIAALQQCDFLVSVDSWSKYIAAAHDIPQLLIVPDQRAEYPALTAPRLLRQELAGLCGRADVDVLGLTKDGEPQLTLAIGDLSPNVLVTRTQRLLNPQASASATRPS